MASILGETGRYTLGNGRTIACTARVTSSGAMAESIKVTSLTINGMASAFSNGRMAVRTKANGSKASSTGWVFSRTKRAEKREGVNGWMGRGSGGLKRRNKRLTRRFKVNEARITTPINI